MKELRRNKRGFESDRVLLGIIREYPGLSQYELAKKLKWPIGRIDGSIRRLLIKKEIFIKVLERTGRIVHLVYPEDDKPSNIIEVPVEQLNVSNPAWLDSAFIYALDSATIGISGHELPEWKEISCLLEKIPIERDAEKLVLKIPDNFKRFYDLERKHKVVSINGNNILITISGNIIEEKRYPS